MVRALRAVCAALVSVVFTLPASGAGTVVFSTKPIDPASPAEEEAPGAAPERSVSPVRVLEREPEPEPEAEPEPEPVPRERVSGEKIPAAELIARLRQAREQERGE